MFRLIRAQTRVLPTRRGGAALEFAVVAPVFFTFTFACIEFARVNMLRNTAEVAATEGARAGVIPGATPALCVAQAKSELSVLGTMAHDVTVTPSTFTPTTDSVRVNVTVPLGAMNGYILTPYFLGKTITSSIELKLEK